MLSHSPNTGQPPPPPLSTGFSKPSTHPVGLFAGTSFTYLPIYAICTSSYVIKSVHIMKKETDKVTMCARVVDFRWETGSEPPVGKGANPAVFSLPTTTCAMSAFTEVDLLTPCRASPAYPFSNTWPPLTTGWYIDVFQYLYWALKCSVFWNFFWYIKTC